MLLGGGSNPNPSHSHSPAPPAAPVSLLRTAAVLLSCIALIGVFASCIILLCSEVTELLGVSNGTVGATMIALGSEVGSTVCIYIPTTHNACILLHRSRTRYPRYLSPGTITTRPPWPEPSGAR